MGGAGGLLARDDAFSQLPKSLCLFHVGRAGADVCASSHVLTYFFTVWNSQQFKVGWGFLPSAINATLSLGSRDAAGVETASSGGVYLEQARERGWG